MQDHLMQDHVQHGTVWHITFGTFGTRLLGDSGPIVERQRNERGTPVLSAHAEPEDTATFTLAATPRSSTPRCLIQTQRLFVERQLPDICDQDGWEFLIAAANADHVHLLCEVPQESHSKEVCQLVKCWLGQSLSREWPLDDGCRWWAEGGSTRAVREQPYLSTVYQYILRQRTTPMPS